MENIWNLNYESCTEVLLDIRIWSPFSQYTKTSSNKIIFYQYLLDNIRTGSYKRRVEVENITDV